MTSLLRGVALLLRLLADDDFCLPADDYRAVRVVHHVVADAAEDGAPDGAHAARADDDHHGMLVVGRLDDFLSRLQPALVSPAHGNLRQWQNKSRPFLMITR